MDTRYELNNWIPNCGVSPKELNVFYRRIDKNQFYSGYTPITFPHPNGNTNKIFKDTDELLSFLYIQDDCRWFEDSIFTRINIQIKEPDPCFNLYKDLKSLEYKYKHRIGIPMRYLFNRDHYREKTMTLEQHERSQRFGYDYDHNFYQGYRFSAHENAD